MTRPSPGRPSAALVRFANGLGPGRALDLGCARGDDAIWLAERGWTVIGIDLTQAALDVARLAAAKAGVAARTTFERHDLSQAFPQGDFELVSAMFLHSPYEFGRVTALRRATAAVAAGGLLLIVAHGSRAPWSWADPDTVYPAARDELAGLQLDMADWIEMFVGPIERQASDPNAQKATVIDAVVALKKISGLRPNSLDGPLGRKAIETWQTVLPQARNVRFEPARADDRQFATLYCNRPVLGKPWLHCPFRLGARRALSGPYEFTSGRLSRQLSVGVPVTIYAARHP